MDKKYIVICFLIIFVIVGGSISYFLLFRNFNNEKCISFSGGGFNIFFNTNGGDEVESIHVGIAVSPDSYQDLPIPVKDGFVFEGWYYDSKLTNKVNTISSRDISPIPKYDNNNCMIGYKDITLFAKWNK